MRILITVLMLGFAQTAAAQTETSPKEQEIVVTGIPDGARAVEVEFDKVWRRCAECKRALAKLDRLAKNYRDEQRLAALMSSGGVAGGSSTDIPSSIGQFSRSSSTDRPTNVAGLELARRIETSGRTYRELDRKYVAPERRIMLAHMQSFLDQLVPHVVAAAEDERVARGARVSLVGRMGMKTSAKRLVRIDVTDAVIKRLDAKQFAINLPDPPPSKHMK